MVNNYGLIDTLKLITKDKRRDQIEFKDYDR